MLMLNSAEHGKMLISIKYQEIQLFRLIFFLKKTYGPGYSCV